MFLYGDVDAVGDIVLVQLYLYLHCVIFWWLRHWAANLQQKESLPPSPRRSRRWGSRNPQPGSSPRWTTWPFRGILPARNPFLTNRRRNTPGWKGCHWGRGMSTGWGNLAAPLRRCGTPEQSFDASDRKHVRNLVLTQPDTQPLGLHSSRPQLARRRGRKSAEPIWREGGWFKVERIGFTSANMG